MRAKVEGMATEPGLTQAESEVYLDALLDDDLGALRVEFSRTVSKQLGEIAGWLAIDSWLGAGDVALTASVGGVGTPAGVMISLQ